MAICLHPVLAKHISFLESIRGDHLHGLTSIIYPVSLIKKSLLSKCNPHWSGNLVWLWGQYLRSMSWAKLTWQSQSLSTFTTGLNLDSSFETDCYIKVKEPRLPYYLIGCGRVVGFIDFSRVLIYVEISIYIMYDIFHLIYFYIIRNYIYRYFIYCTITF